MTAGSAAPSHGRAWLLLGALVVVWGCHWTVAKVGLQSIPPFTYAMLRLVTGVAVLAVLMQGAGRLRPPARADVRIIVSYGLLAIAMGITVMNLAVPLVGAGRSSILAYTLPLWVVPILAVTARVRPVTSELLGLALGLTGLALLINPAVIDWSEPRVLLGCGLLILGAMTGALGLVHVRAHHWVGTPFDVQIWQLLVALVPMLVLAVALEADRWSSIAWTPQLVLVVLYSGPLATAFAFWASQSITRAIGPMRTSMGYLGAPIVGVVTGALILGEQVGPLEVLGLVVTGAGILVVLLARRPAADAAPVAEDEVEAALADGAELPGPASTGR